MRVKGRIVMLGAATLGLAVLVGGCSSIRDHRGYLIDTALVDSIQPQVDNRTSVEKTLGRPTWVSQFGAQDWYYVSVDTKQAAFKRPKTYQQTVLRVRFDQGGNVAAVDKAGVEKVARISPDGKVTPTLGRERSFIEDLFGNIGAVGVPGAGGGAGPAGPGPNGS
ncbi:outer membrane protein assembly factor BamE [Novosphingobium sp. JCM 18896]|uniref:outer membrane protein assembly factor BamE n=1 Tax=Novosphingobium sp. JCM 18896 TaxID=2989731 RepID=UPI0022237D4A|nr:outer membrane protein assembly factor BamE [Novosphingobium sp. JCM 18896]MCW1430856.1 outer membrane protein assembly factor BamE [Novosphingobium sp. JCM 18896]